MNLIDDNLLRAFIADEVRRVVRDEITPKSAGAEFLSVGEAARIASTSRQTIRKWLRHGRLKRHAVGRSLRVLRSDLERALATPPPGRGKIVPESPEELAARAFEMVKQKRLAKR